MINLRYHIVSITAVFLALGIGLAFGAAFIDRATVDALNNNLTEIEAQNEDLERVNGELAREVLDSATAEGELREQALPQLVDGRLDEVPVLVVASEGVAGEVVDAAEAAVLAGGARMAAVLRVTDRFVLDDDAELEELRAVLHLPGAGAEQLRAATVRRLRAVLAEAARPPEEDDTFESVIDPPPVPVPELFQALADAGFLEIEPVEEPAAGFALVPERGLRLLAVSGPDGTDAETSLLLPLVRALVTPPPAEVSGPPLPVVVAAQPSVPPPGEDDPEPPPGFVASLRADPALATALSTVDHLDTFAGLLAAVLALEHGADGQLGHYGTDEDAQSIVPPLPA